MADGFLFSLMLAALGGLLSFLSPCVLPLVPGYLCFAAGMDYDELTEANRQAIYARVLPSALAFVLGFSVVFISLGAGAAAINPFILGHKDILGKIAGVFIILLGLHMSGILRLNFLQKNYACKNASKKINHGNGCLPLGWGWLLHLGGRPVLAQFWQLF